MERPQCINTKMCLTLSAMSKNTSIDTKLCATTFRNTSDPSGFLSIDLISPSENATKGSQYALTVICMLTNYVICIPIPDKSQDIVVNAHLKDVYCRFGGS